MITLEQALENILGCVSLLPWRQVPLAHSFGAYLQADVTSSVDLPGFDNSAMDGYAVRSADLSGASIEAPVRLRSVQHIAAGKASSSPLQAGECARIFTGSPVPPGSDAVVMQEDVTLDGSFVRFIDPVKPWENLRLRGEDIHAGEIIARSGEKVNAPKIAVMAAGGIASVSVGSLPSIAILATGNELTCPGSPLASGSIYESNRVMLAALAHGAGIEPGLGCIIRDSLSETSEALKAAFRSHDVVVTSGGVSVGEYDFVKAAFEQIGGNWEFWQVAIKPGKPFVFGKLGEKYLFGLPGNPVSAAVTFLLLVRPALLKMQGASRTSLPVVQGKLSQDFTNHGDRRHFVRVKFERGEVSSAGPQGSHLLRSFSSANGLLDLPPGDVKRAGTLAEVLLFGELECD